MTTLSLPKTFFNRPLETVTRLKEPLWEFDGSGAYYKLGKGYGTRAAVDPFPAYSHSEVYAWGLISTLEVHIPVDIYLLEHELESRVNGWTDINYVWDEKGHIEEQNHIICLSGKRTPIPQGMQYYILAHEYGHAVENFLSEKTGNEDFRVEYAEMRKVDLMDHYGGRSWKNAPGEVLADDFRILVAHQEVNYWPHDKVTPPHKLDYLYEWWDEKINDINQITRDIPRRDATSSSERQANSKEN